MFTSTNPTPVQSDVLDDFIVIILLETLVMMSQQVNLILKNLVEQLKQIQDEYKKLLQSKVM